MIGTVVSHYKIIEKLGSGGMGIVYKAQDLKLDRFVALKFLPPHLTTSDEEKQRFIHEAKAASALQHNNICAIHEIDETEDGQIFICMDYYEGETLDKKINEKPLPIEEAIDITIQIALGLAKAHEKEIVHRDIKPANIMLTKEGVVKVLDFGLAKLATQTKLTKDGTTLGTIAYMSPEQARGDEVDHRTDIWSLGVMFYEMVAGELPFKGDYEQAIIYAILNSDPLDEERAQSTIPQAMNQLLQRMLQKNPQQRYASIDQFLMDLKNCKENQTVGVKSRKPKLLRFWLPVSFLLLLIIISVFLYWQHTDTATIAKSDPVQSVAVLPFVNMSDQKENEYFSDGLSESIINALTKIKDLRVVARTSSFSFKGQDISIEEIGKKLHVAHILEGSVQKSDNRLRITAQLIKVSDGFHLWSQQFDKELKDVFAIQDEIALAIVDRLKLDLLPAEKEHLIKRYTDNIDAYNDYLKGHFFWNKRTKEGFEKSIRYYRAALEKDPDFVLPYAGLADVYASLGWYDFRPKKEVFDTSKAYALQALEIDDNNGQAHLAMGNYKAWCEFDWVSADMEYRQALQLNPSNAEIHHQYAHILEVRGLFDQAINEMQQAINLEPLTVNFNTCLGQIMYFDRQYDAAGKVLNKSIEIDSTHFWAYYWLGRVRFAIGEMDKAIELLNKSSTFPSVETISLGTIGYIYAQSGQTDKALKIFDQLIKMSERRIVDPLYIAWIYLGLNDRDNTFQYLDQAYDGLSSYLMMINVDPFYDDLRRDERFQQLLQKMGF